MKKKNRSKFVYWTPRILSIVFILFLMLISLDVFDSNPSFWQAVLGLLIHNIPALILLAVLIVSWKYEIVGGIVFILAGLAYIGLTLTRVPGYLALSWSTTIAGPAFFIGALFLVGWFKKK